MLKIGLTGGIGSGKTLVSKVFQNLGIPVYCADDKAKQLINESINLKQEIISVFGDEAYINGNYNKKFIAGIVFNDAIKLKVLNEIIHPAVEKDFINWVKEISLKTPFILKEAAILFESGTYKQLDKIIYVTAETETRIQRVIDRDSTNREQVINRIKNQWPTDKGKQLADFVLDNTGKKLILPQILDIYNQLNKEWQNLVNG
ncbi:MAG: dephospho-CoA kinase [Bacteroidales bacterium]|nr:dephospho-CoA kinase [Bacteroidales bacterium]MBN2819672.1 dephospho-CoA kinase [Bacteroidales bacterium]